MLRRTILKALPKRSGGHAHPDFPFLGNYKHKRIISIYETNLWIYDGVQPEYLVDFWNPHITGPVLAFRCFMFTIAIPLAVMYLTVQVVYPFFTKPYRSFAWDNPNSNVKKFHNKIVNERVFQKKNPLGLVNVPDYPTEGWVANEHPAYRKFKV
ncbi:unnamed protein product [Blepharisma stoltei]|uniref:Uncharacterized protein n=1 Tax=Blepharisma stoltei TaxID=1481888 RepID=A0AAU9K8W1_9CILI|nr:unnamed protein product [Blepharisma stoltei]